MIVEDVLVCSKGKQEQDMHSRFIPPTLKEKKRNTKQSKSEFLMSEV